MNESPSRGAAFLRGYTVRRTQLPVRRIRFRHSGRRLYNPRLLWELWGRYGEK